MSLDRQGVSAYSYCPECGMVWRNARETCPFNGADAVTIPVDPAIGEELIRMSNEFGKDDGTVVRVGRWALLRDTDHVGRKRWGVKRFRDGREYRTGYGKTPWQAGRRAVR